MRLDELRRRLEALDRGEATLIPAEQALASARERVAVRRLRRAGPTSPRSGR